MEIKLSRAEVRELVILLSLVYNISLVEVHRNRAIKLYRKLKGCLE